MKKEFRTDDIYYYNGGFLKIVTPAQPKDKEREKRNPYIRIYATNKITFLNKDIERFAVNILKALKSKKLKP